MASARLCINILITAFAVTFLSSCPNPGMPDLVPSGQITAMFYNSTDGNWEETTGEIAEKQTTIFFKYKNMGGAQPARPFTINFYLSSDRIITPDDILLAADTDVFPIAQGLNPAFENSFYTVVANLPSVPAGTYYLGYILDANSEVEEANESNNTSPPELTAQVVIKDPGSNPAGGAFKIVNSWGTAGGWEKIPDGHYWITYNSMKALQMPIFYYNNTFTVAYHPTIIARFKITHPKRNECKITIGIGNPYNPVFSKEFQERLDTTLYGGALPFPDNGLALDVSEFSSAINNSGLFISITTNVWTPPGTLDSFTVEYYSVSTGNHLLSVTGMTGKFGGMETTTTFNAHTTNALDAGQLAEITPTTRSSNGTNPFIESLPTYPELDADKSICGVYEPGKNYNLIAFGKYGTGYVPPTEEQWQNMKKLRSVSFATRGTFANQKADHSTTQYFPPIGNQGTKGSCTCFSTAYYIHTYEMAKENNWDLSGTLWSGTSPGAPDRNLTKIMSPDFVYNQINQGVDEGSGAIFAFSLLTSMGCASWNTMPYNQADWTSWPSETAYREAAHYRASDINTLFGNLSFGYFIIRDDSDINLLKNLVEAGYCVTSSIDGSKSDDNKWLFSSLDNNDVIDNGSLSPMTLNHAQTIVGFKDGSSWHISTPDD